MSNNEKAVLHRGAALSSPYPVSRLAPAFDSGELAAEVARAESMLSARTGAKLRVIADQIKLLQQEARKVLGLCYVFCGSGLDSAPAGSHPLEHKSSNLLLGLWACGREGRECG